VPPSRSGLVESGDAPTALQQFEAGARANPADKLVYEKAIVGCAIGPRKDQRCRHPLGCLGKEYQRTWKSRPSKPPSGCFTGEPRQIQAAVAQLEDLTKLKPDDLKLGYGLAQAYRVAKDWEAAAAISKVLERNRSSLDARIGLAEAVLEQNKPARLFVMRTKSCSGR